MKITLIGLNHEVQWKDPTGHLHRTLSDLLTSSKIDLIAEEASGLPTTVGQRLSCKLNKPWINMDMTRAERIEAGIGESVERWGMIGDGDKLIEVFRYVPEFDDVREKYWLTRLLKCRMQFALCLCGVPWLWAGKSRRRASFHEGLREQGLANTPTVFPSRNS